MGYRDLVAVAERSLMFSHPSRELRWILAQPLLVAQRTARRRAPLMLECHMKDAVSRSESVG